MKYIMTTIAVLAMTTTAFANGNDYQQTRVVKPAPTSVVNNGGKGGTGGQGGAGGTGIGQGGNASAVAAAAAAAKANATGGSVKNSGNSFSNNTNKNTNSNRNVNQNVNKQGQKQTQQQGQQQTATSNSGGNSISNSNSYRAAASTAYAPSGQTTAPCQKYASAGGQTMNFGLSFGLNFDSKKCWDMFRAEEYKKVYGKSVVRAYYEANDPVLRRIVSGQTKKK